MILRLFFALLVATIVSSISQAQDDISERREQSKSRYFESEKEFDRAILDWFDTQEKRARSRGDRDSVVEIKATRRSYVDAGKLPGNAPRIATRKRESGKLRLQSDYNSIISSLTRLGRDKEATATENELALLLSGQGQPIFNGRDLSGWEGLPQFWAVKGGVIHGTTGPNGLPKPTYLVSKKEYSNFELQCEVRLTGENPDSGFMFRGKVIDPNTFEIEGPQYDFSKRAWGRLILQRPRTKTSQPEVLVRPDRATIASVVKPKEFNALLVRCVDDRLIVKLNGQVMIEGDFPKLPDKGVIAWQLWSGGKPFAVQIKNARLTEL